MKKLAMGLASRAGKAARELGAAERCNADDLRGTLDEAARELVLILSEILALRGRL